MREVNLSATLTPRLRRLAAIFGLSLRRVHEAGGASRSRAGGVACLRDRECAAAAALMPLMRPGVVVFITGPSGGGKSSLLRTLRPMLRRRRVRVVNAGVEITCGRTAHTHSGASIVDRLARESRRGDAGALDALAAAGLAEATLLMRCDRELSDGQRARFALARAMAACSRGAGSSGRRQTCMIADEFASTLDLATALSLATSVARWVRARGVICVLSTAREDVIDALDADVLVYVPFDAPIRVESRVGGVGGEHDAKRARREHRRRKG